MVIVVFGPRTRLAGALIERATARSHRALLVARDEAEQSWCRSRHPEAASLAAWRDDSRLEDSDAPTGFALCGFGPIRPAEPVFARDAAALLRDLGLLERLLRGCRRARVVFVSSVLALWPRPERAYYAGFKAVALDALSEVVAAAPGASLSALFPGRLVDERSWRRPASLLHTSYRKVAARVLDSVESAAPRRALVGADARLFACARGVVSIEALLAGRA